MMRLLRGVIVATLSGAAAVQAQAQDPAPLRATEDCRSQGKEPVVCGRAQRSPYRLPETRQGFDPGGTTDSVSRERHRLLDLGAVGIHSCSTVGPGGWTGCDLVRWKEKHEQYGGARRDEPRLSFHVGRLRKSVIE